ncbi:hypothetical protein HanRHA438_Chr02g0057031 [Helianthus annuus]|nr:hypothetical protein HanRHA438_Chr02g0057031 [Helianthus annuus]
MVHIPFSISMCFRRHHKAAVSFKYKVTVLIFLPSSTMSIASKYCSISQMKSSTARASRFPTNGDGFGTSVFEVMMVSPRFASACLQMFSSICNSLNFSANLLSILLCTCPSSFINISFNSACMTCIASLMSSLNSPSSLPICSSDSLVFVWKISTSALNSSTCVLNSAIDVSTSSTRLSKLATKSLDMSRFFLPPLRVSSRPRVSSPPAVVIS